MVEDNLIKLQVEREITSLFKDYLEVIDKLNLEDTLHAELRKHVLDKGNDTIRNLLQFLSYFDFVINAQRVEEASRRQIIYRKTITSPPVII